MMRFLTLALALLLAAGSAAAQSNLLTLPPASLPLNGLDQTYVVQNGVSKTAPISGVISGITTATPITATGTNNTTSIGNYVSRLPSLSVLEAGAKCDGTTDDTAKLNQAFATAGVIVLLPNTVCFSATGVTIPGGSDVEGSVFLSGTASSGGSTIQCGLSVAVCITAGSNNNQAVTLKRINITRAAGTLPTSNAECLKINGADGVILEDLVCYRHATGYHLVGAAGMGTIANANRLFTCAISDTHIIIDGWSVARFNLSYFGCNGSADVSGNNFIKVTGGDTTDGPNTLNFTNSQFNLGANSVTCWLNFASLGLGQGSAIQSFEFVGDHIETAQNLMCSDASATNIENLAMTNVWAHGGWGGTNHVFAFNAATLPNEWRIANSIFTGWTDLTLAPSGQMNSIKFANNDLLMPVSITGGSSGTTLDFSDNRWAGLTLAGSFGQGKFTGENTAGTYSSTATGFISSDLPMTTAWTPNLVGAGGSGSPSYTTQIGYYYGDLSRVTAVFNISTSATPTGYTGNMSIANLPIASQASSGSSSCVLGSYTGITLSSGYTQLALTIGQNAAAAGLVQSGSGVNSGFLQPSNFTGAVTLQGSCTYRVR